MNFSHPQWFLLLPLFFLLGWRWPRLRFHEPLRVVSLILAVLVLANPRMRLASNGLDLWVLADCSNSARAQVHQNLGEWKEILRKSKGAQDRIRYVNYADAVQVEEEAGEAFPGKGHESRTGFAVAYALSRMDPERVSRMLVLTDGFHTEPMDSVSEALRKQGVALDYRLVTPPDVLDYRVKALEIPTRVQPDQAFMIRAKITGKPDGEVGYRVLFNGREVMKNKAMLRGGEAWIRLSDRIASPGAYQYQVEIDHPDDKILENNRASHWIEVSGEPRVLLVTSYEVDPLAAVLQARGFDVKMVNHPASLTVGDLSSVKTVILNNVPAYLMPEDVLSALPFFVRSQGGGLLMVGGKRSFGSGGYYSSKVDELLPVSMELKKEHRQLAVAMSIVMDRSGSMGAGVSSGGKRMTKMDLANEGTARTIELLGDYDTISVLAVDSEAHTVIEQAPLGPDRKKLLKTVRKINSGGGGIFVYTGLKAAWEQLKKTEIGQRHIILFSDAADSEEPGDYRKLLEEIEEGGGTVSVIGLGSEFDTDADFLKDIADRGHGRIFFNTRPQELPALFAQETVTVARSAFIEEPVAWVETPGWSQLAARTIPWPDKVDGYNLSYLKPEATSAAVTGDEYRAPLIAFWQRGTGRSAAVSFPLGGPFSQNVRAWEQYGDFTQTLVRWLKGEETPPGLVVTTSLQGTVLQIDFFHDENWMNEIVKTSPVIYISEGFSDAIEEVPWEQMKPGHFQARVKLSPQQWLRGVVQLGEVTLPFGPVVNGIDSEWSRDYSRVRELKQISLKSGGGERLDFSEIWQSQNRSFFREIRMPLLILLMILMLTDAFLTRVQLSPLTRIRTKMAERFSQHRND